MKYSPPKQNKRDSSHILHQILYLSTIPVIALMATLRGIYENFLSNPGNVSCLLERASLHYVPTLTSINSPANITKQLLNQNVLRTKAQKTLSAVEGPDSLCLDVETTLEFVSGGGNYLPGLDGNFLTDKIVTFPTVRRLFRRLVATIG